MQSFEEGELVVRRSLLESRWLNMIMIARHAYKPG